MSSNPFEIKAHGSDAHLPWYDRVLVKKKRRHKIER